MNNSWNLLLAIGLSVLIVFGWDYFYIKPEVKKQLQENSRVTKDYLDQNSSNKVSDQLDYHNQKVSDKRIPISSKMLEGSINLIGLKFDDIVLLKYKENLNTDSKNVSLLKKEFTNNSYFINFTWCSDDSYDYKLFVGPKKVDLLDFYESKYNILLFDRAIDFGWFYILTKPIFNVLNFFYDYVGNFGISILIVTVLIRILLFQVANKSYKSMKKMKELHPQIDELKKLYASDKIRLNQEIMALYKSSKVNPLSGCLPILMQIPIFFSIYKVLNVTIEMRQAPFFGWIKDLSAPDSTSIFNLFGLLPFTPPSYLMIGALPIFMSFTMYLQQKLSPEPTDQVQAQLTKFMPLIFLFMFNNFAAGLLIYWSWNNILSIIQQYFIIRNK